MNVSELVTNTFDELFPPPPMRDGDYIKDGVIHCGVCHKPREKVVERFNGNKNRHFPRNCDCDIARIEQEAKERERIERPLWVERQQEEDRKRIKKLRKDAFDNVMLADWTFEADDKANEKITNIAKKYVENYYEFERRGKGLLLYGGVGTGKSFMAACIVNALIDEYKETCLFTNFSKLSNALLGRDYGEKQSFVDEINRNNVLVIDDFGSERETEFMNEVVYSIIDARHTTRKPLIVTTNLTGDELKHPNTINKERVFSRLFELCVPVEVKGSDRRKLKLRDENKELRELLGLEER